MPATKAQTYANHARFDPAFHFFILPLLLLNIIFSIIHAYRHPTYFNIWFVVLSIGLFVTAGLVRSYPLKAQDRIIFLEERLRLKAVTTEPLRSRIDELTPQQLIGLRFAADEEAPELVKRALDEHLTRKQIKQAINNWRPDHWRI
jgi:hypothetical protein